MANTTQDNFIPSGVLSDAGIKKAIKAGLLEIKAPHPLAYQPASIDVHLAPTIMTFARRRIKSAVIDLKKPMDEFVDFEKLTPITGTIIHPHEFILGVTTEWLKLSNEIIVNVDGKSSLGRVGLIIHVTAGFVDPGYTGHITLEIINMTDMPMVIYPNMLIGQFRFTKLSLPSDKLYGPQSGSKYNNPYSKNPKPIPSQYWKNFVK